MPAVCQRGMGRDCAQQQSVPNGALQNPKERITLSKMMKHPWVTRRGNWPLRSVKEMIRVGERPELPPVLPDLMSTLNVLDIPRQVLSFSSGLHLLKRAACWVYIGSVVCFGQKLPYLPKPAALALEPHCWLLVLHISGMSWTLQLWP